MNKKADSQVLIVIFELLVVALVVFTTARVAHSYGSSLLTQKVNLAQDIAMMADTLAGVPGDAMVQYPENVSQFSIILSKKSVLVFEKDDTEAERVSRSFILPEGYDAFGTLQQENLLCLEKKGKAIILRKCEPERKEKAEEESKEIPAGPTFYGLAIEGDPVVFVIDRSGSMERESGWVFPQGLEPPGQRKIDVAKWQLKTALQGMETGKRFNLVFFDSDIKTFKPGLVELNDQTREEAFAFIDTFEPGTTTNTGEAVQKALSLGEIEALYLLSDGRPNIVPLALAQIKSANAADKAKINVIAIFTKIPDDISDTERETFEKERQQGQQFLQQIADENGGVFVTQE